MRWRAHRFILSSTFKGCCFQNVLVYSWIMMSNFLVLFFFFSGAEHSLPTKHSHVHSEQSIRVARRSYSGRHTDRCVASLSLSEVRLLKCQMELTLQVLRKVAASSTDIDIYICVYITVVSFYIALKGNTTVFT